MAPFDFTVRQNGSAIGDTWKISPMIANNGGVIEMDQPFVI